MGTLCSLLNSAVSLKLLFKKRSILKREVVEAA